MRILVSAAVLSIFGCAADRRASGEPSSPDADADGRADDPGGVDAAPAAGLIDVDLEGSHQNACWSPEGNRIVFTRFRAGYNEGLSDLALVGADGGAATLLTRADAQNVNLPGSCWSQALGRIVYSSDDLDRDEVWLVSADGGAPERVTRRTGQLAWEPSFSPDGEWIVFESHPASGADESSGSLWKVRRDGSGLAQLSDGSADDRQPNWSPAGDRILFQSLERGNWDVFTIDPSGGSRTRVTEHEGDDTDASFSPDGLRIVYSSDEGLDHADLFVIAVTGGTPSRLHAAEGYAGAPSWSPDGRWIAFETSEAVDPDGSAGTRLAIVAAP